MDKSQKTILETKEKLHLKQIMIMWFYLYKGPKEEKPKCCLAIHMHVGLSNESQGMSENWEAQKN